MSLMSFMKEAGEKLFGGGTAQAATPASNPDAANQAAADAIVTYIRAQNLDAENLSVVPAAPSRSRVRLPTRKPRKRSCCAAATWPAWSRSTTS